jgi:hypothetical protein
LGGSLGPVPVLPRCQPGVKQGVKQGVNRGLPRPLNILTWKEKIMARPVTVFTGQWADLIFDVLRGKAGNLAEIITENLPSVLKAVALSGLIAVGGIMVGCDLGTGANPGNNNGQNGEDPGGKKDEEEDEEKDWTIIQKQLYTVSPVTAQDIRPGHTPLTAKNIINNTAIGTANSAENMKINIGMYRSGRDYHKITKGMPTDDEFLEKILKFNVGGFVHGHDGMTQYNQTRFADMTDLLANFPDMVKEEDRELFKKLIAAYRGVNFIQARDRATDDYTAPISLSAGTQTNIGNLLQDVNGSNGEREDYSLTGNYPTPADLRADIFDLLPESPDSAYPGLIKDTVTIMGNFEQLYGLLTRAYSVGQDHTLSTEAINAITTATIQDRESVTIDRPASLQKLTASYLMNQQSQMGQ